MFVAAVVFPVLAWMGWSARSARMVEDELSKIRQAGEPVDAGDLQMFFAAPPREQDATQLWLDGLAILAHPSFEGDAKELPIVGSGPDIPLPGEGWEQLEEVEEFLEQYQEALAKFHDAAKLGGRARYEKDFEAGWMEMELPHVQEQRGAGRMLALEANVRAHRGDAQGAAESIRAIFASSRALEGELIVVSQLVRIALNGIALGELERLLNSVDFSDADLSRLQEEVRSVDLQPGMTKSLIGERAMGIDGFRNPAKLGNKIPIAIFGRNQDLAFYLKTMSKCIAASREPFPRAFDERDNVDAEFNDDFNSRTSQMRYPLTMMLIPAIDAMFEATARGEGANETMDVAIAIQRYRKAQGKLPESLDELVPDYLRSVPRDPFDGMPIRYLIDDDGAFRVYSIGRNRVDDEGVLSEERLDEVISITDPKSARDVPANTEPPSEPGNPSDPAP
jgi:hypothetical protein